MKIKKSKIRVNQKEKGLRALFFRKSVEGYVLSESKEGKICLIPKQDDWYLFDLVKVSNDGEVEVLVTLISKIELSDKFELYG